MIEIGAMVVALAAIATLIFEKRQNALREKEWALERGALLNRLQFPEIAKTEASPEPTGEKLYVGFDDDEEHDAYVEAAG